MMLELIAALALVQYPQESAARETPQPEVQQPQAEETEGTEEQPRRVCRYERTLGSGMQRRVCTDERPQRRSVSTMHSTWEAQSNLRRLQGSRLPDGS